MFLPRAASLIVLFYEPSHSIFDEESFSVGVENNNDFDSTDDEMEERGVHDDSPCIQIYFLCRSLGYAAYRQFCWWIQARIG